MADTQKIMKCPACGKEMKKIHMDEAGVMVDICLDGCGGMVFDNRELNKFDEAHENIDEILAAIKNKEFIKVDETLVRHCPVCGVKMVKMGAGVAGVQIDNCNVCGAKFLDNGELQAIRNNDAQEQDARLESMLNVLCSETIDNVTYGKMPEKSSPRRQYVENLVRKFL